MALDPLTNPLTQLSLLDKSMNWRGAWSPTIQYYANNVVISPSDGLSYILVGQSVILGGADPATNADWFALVPAPIVPPPPIVPLNPPRLTLLGELFNLDPNPIPSGAAGDLTIIGSPPTSLFETYLADPGPPAADTNPTFLINFNNINLLAAPPVSPTVPPDEYVLLQFIDNVTAGGPYTYTPAGPFPLVFSPTANYPLVAALGQVVFDITAARATGVRQVDSITFNNNTRVGLESGASGAVYVVYYPYGLQ